MYLFPSLSMMPLKIKLSLLNLLVFMWMRISRGMYISIIELKKLLLALVSWREVWPFVTFEVLSSIYSALVQPYFDYCTFVWGICNKFLATKLQKRQNRAARILTFSPYDASVDNLFTSFAWKKLEAHCKIQTASMVYKSLNGLALQYLNSLFPIVMKSLVSLSGIPRASYSYCTAP